MTTDRMTSRWHTFGWVGILVLGVLMVSAGLFILSQPVDAGDFENQAGMAWEDYQASNPEAADYLVREARLLGWAFAVLGGVAAAMALTLLRKGNRTAWAIVWFVAVALAGSAAVFYSSGGTALGSFYAVTTLAAVFIIVIGQRAVPR